MRLFEAKTAELDKNWSIFFDVIANTTGFANGEEFISYTIFFAKFQKKEFRNKQKCVVVDDLQLVSFLR